MNIEFTTNSSSTDIDFITQKINEESLEFGSAYPFAFYIKDEDSKLIAGCNGSVIFGSIYTDQLWVDHKHRKMGLGKQLMDQVHDYGLKMGCTSATVTTMSFQNALSFYENLGYNIDFERAGYSHQSRCIYLKRNL